MKQINYSRMTKAERQAFADFQMKEVYRHYDDIKKIKEDLEYMKSAYGIKPREIFVNTWIEVKDSTKMEMEDK